MYQIDRKTAAKTLKVSIRTVDRYIAQKKLSIEKKDNRIWLDKKEVLGLKRKKRVDTVVEPLSIDNGDRHVVDSEATDVDFMSTSVAEKSAINKQKTEDSVYKKLFEELQQELRIKQERLEGANYRVGQLEALVKESVPLLDHQRLLGEEKAVRLELEENIELIQEKLNKTKQKLHDENTSKKVYIIALFIILLVQPLWLILASN